MNLQQLHKEIDNCFNCKLSKLSCNTLDSNNPIYGKLLTNYKIKNPEKPKLLLIGISPSFLRFDSQRRAFEGVSPSNNLNEIKTSGDFFYFVLDKSKLKEYDIYITNLLKCSIENNSQPEEESIKQCQRLLELEIKIVKPDYIITMGNLVKNYVSKMRLEKKILAIKHPSFYFRFKSEKSVQDELKEFNDLADFIEKDCVLLNRWV